MEANVSNGQLGVCVFVTLSDKLKVLGTFTKIKEGISK